MTRAISRLPGSFSRVLQRKCNCSDSAPGGCDSCKKKQLQRKATGLAADIAPPIVHEVLRSSGQPLDAATRAYMEPKFGHDFSKVRVHTDAKAAESAEAVNALAYTFGNDIVFKGAEYSPARESGRELLAHELSHVIQQQVSSTFVAGPLMVGKATSPDEREADTVARAIVNDQATTSSRLAANVGVIQRRCDKPEQYYRDSSAFCRDATFSTKTHAGKTCYREVIPEGASGCPPGDHCCFGPDGMVEDSRDTSSLAEARESDGTCNWSWACVVAHTLTDYLPAVTNLDCFTACKDVPGPGKFWCLQSCSARKHQ